MSSPTRLLDLLACPSSSSWALPSVQSQVHHTTRSPPLYSSLQSSSHSSPLLLPPVLLALLVTLLPSTLPLGPLLTLLPSHSSLQLSSHSSPPFLVALSTTFFLAILPSPFTSPYTLLSPPRTPSLPSTSTLLYYDSSSPHLSSHPTLHSSSPDHPLAHPLLCSSLHPIALLTHLSTPLSDSPFTPLLPSLSDCLFSPPNPYHKA